MDFKDYRIPADEKPTEPKTTAVRKYFGKRFNDLVEELIHEAQNQGKFDNLAGQGRPLNLDINPYLGDKALGYSLLKSNGYAPREIELAKEIRAEYARAEARLERYRHQSRALRSRRIPPFASEKRAFNTAVSKAADAYEKTLRDLNRKILTLNLSAPIPLHMAAYNIETAVQRFREECPVFE